MGRQTRHRASTATSKPIAKVTAALAVALLTLLAAPAVSMGAPAPCGGRTTSSRTYRPRGSRRRPGACRV